MNANKLANADAALSRGGRALHCSLFVTFLLENVLKITIAAVVVKLLAQTGCGIVQLNLPGDSTLQWGVGQGLSSVASLVLIAL